MEEDGDSFTNWRPGQPNGGESQNFMSMSANQRQWDDADNTNTRYAVCSKPIASAANDTIGRRKRQAFGSNTNGNLADGTAPETIVSNSAIPKNIDDTTVKKPSGTTTTSTTTTLADDVSSIALIEESSETTASPIAEGNIKHISNSSFHYSHVSSLQSYETV